MKKWKMFMGFVLLIVILSGFASGTAVTIRYENYVKDNHDDLYIKKWVNCTVVHNVFKHIGGTNPKDITDWIGMSVYIYKVYSAKPSEPMDNQVVEIDIQVFGYSDVLGIMYPGDDHISEIWAPRHLRLDASVSNGAKDGRLDFQLSYNNGVNMSGVPDVSEPKTENIAREGVEFAANIVMDEITGGMWSVGLYMYEHLEPHGTYHDNYADVGPNCHAWEMFTIDSDYNNGKIVWGDGMSKVWSSADHDYIYYYYGHITYAASTKILWRIPQSEEDDYTLHLSAQNLWDGWSSYDAWYGYGIEGSSTSVDVKITYPLQDALDTHLHITTGGSAKWHGVTYIEGESMVDGDAAQSGKIGDGKSTYLQTKVKGPGTLKFKWTVSSEQNKDYLKFYIDNILEARISGELGYWKQMSYHIGSGEHTLKWTYEKSSSGSDGKDCGWVDDVEWTPDTYFISITSPGSNAHWYIRHVHRIKWNSEGVSRVTISLYKETDNGLKFITTITNRLSNKGYYDWYISSSISGGKYKLLIEDADYGVPYDYSETFYISLSGPNPCPTLYTYSSDGWKEENNVLVWAENATRPFLNTVDSYLFEANESNGNITIGIGEPGEDVDFVDTVKLYRVYAPLGYDVAESYGGMVYAYRDVKSGTAKDSRGENVTSLIGKEDNNYWVGEKGEYIDVTLNLSSENLLVIRGIDNPQEKWELRATQSTIWVYANVSNEWIKLGEIKVRHSMHTNVINLDALSGLFGDKIELRFEMRDRNGIDFIGIAHDYRIANVEQVSLIEASYGYENISVRDGNYLRINPGDFVRLNFQGKGDGLYLLRIYGFYFNRDMIGKGIGIASADEVNIAEAKLQESIEPGKYYVLLPLLEDYSGICHIAWYVDGIYVPSSKPVVSFEAGEHEIELYIYRHDGSVDYYSLSIS